MDLSVEPRLSQAELEAQYLRTRVRDAGNPAIDFSLLRSRHSIEIAVPPIEPTVDRNKVMVALFGRDGEKFGIEVDVVLLQREMSGADWLLLWLGENGYSVRAQRILASPAGDLADVLATRTVEGSPYIYRMRTYKDGRYVYLVEARALYSNYAQYEDEFFVATSSFSLTNPSGEISAEPLRTYRFTNPTSAVLQMPTSWQMSPDSMAPGASMRFNADYPPLDRTYGNIIVSILPAARFRTAQDVEWPYLKTLGENGFQVRGGALQPVPGRSDVWRAERHGSRDGKPMNSYTIVLNKPEGWVLFGMISPEPEIKAAGIEEIDRRALDIAVSTFRFQE